MSIESQAVMEIARLIASQPSPEQIVDFYASPETAARAYTLIAAERAGAIMKVWTETLRRLTLVAALSGESMVTLLARLSRQDVAIHAPRRTERQGDER